MSSTIVNALGQTIGPGSVVIDLHPRIVSVIVIRDITPIKQSWTDAVSLYHSKYRGICIDQSASYPPYAYKTHGKNFRKMLQVEPIELGRYNYSPEFIDLVREERQKVLTGVYEDKKRKT